MGLTSDDGKLWKFTAQVEGDVIDFMIADVDSAPDEEFESAYEDEEEEDEEDFEDEDYDSEDLEDDDEYED